MKVLYLSGLYPSKSNSSGGIFVTRRCQYIKDYVDYDLYSILNNDNWLVKTMKKLLKKSIYEYSRGLDVDGVRWNYLPYNSSIVDIAIGKANPGYVIDKKAKLLERKVDIKKYDLIHAHYAYQAGNIALELKKKYGIPYVLTVHGSDIHTNPLNDDKVKIKTLEALENADRVIFVSSALFNTAKGLGYSGKNGVVIPNGFDSGVFKLMDKESIKERLGLKNKVVGFAGNLIHIKRADKLSDIFDKIRNKYNDVDFLVIGDGNLMGQVKGECKDKNLNVIFTGRVPQGELAEYMNAMDVMILPSRNEGFPTVVNEAAACGIPAVGSNVGGVKEAIEGYGFVVDEGDAFEERFADAVIEVLKGKFKEQNMVEKAQKYRWENIVNREYECYMKVIDKNS